MIDAGDGEGGASEGGEGASEVPRGSDLGFSMVP